MDLEVAKALDRAIWGELKREPRLIPHFKVAKKDYIAWKTTSLMTVEEILALKEAAAVDKAARILAESELEKERVKRGKTHARVVELESKETLVTKEELAALKDGLVAERAARVSAEAKAEEERVLRESTERKIYELEAKSAKPSTSQRMVWTADEIEAAIYAAIEARRYGADSSMLKPWHREIVEIKPLFREKMGADWRLLKDRNGNPEMEVNPHAGSIGLTAKAYAYAKKAGFEGVLQLARDAAGMDRQWAQGGGPDRALSHSPRPSEA